MSLSSPGDHSRHFRSPGYSSRSLCFFCESILLVTTHGTSVLLVTVPGHFASPANRSCQSVLLVTIHVTSTFHANGSCHSVLLVSIHVTSAGHANGSFHRVLLVSIHIISAGHTNVSCHSVLLATIRVTSARRENINKTQKLCELLQSRLGKRFRQTDNCLHSLPRRNPYRSMGR